MIEGVENIIHYVLKLTRGILKTKWHNIPLITFKMSGKSSFVPIILTNLDLPEPRFHIKLGKHHSFTHPMDQVILIGNRIPNPLQNLIQGFVVDYQSRGSSFNFSIFLDIKSRTRPRGLAISNQFFLQQIMNFFFAKFNSFNIHLNRTSFSGNVFLIKIFNIR